MLINNVNLWPYRGEIHSYTYSYLYLMSPVFAAYVKCCVLHVRHVHTHTSLSLCRLWRATSVLPVTASVRYLYTARDSQLKCVRKLFYTNLSLTFSPNEAWPKVLQGQGGGCRGRRGWSAWSFEAHKARLVAFVVYERAKASATRH